MSDRKNIIIVISGPTATGKTSTSIEVAKKINGHVLNFDSLVFYKEISIGTAKPTPEEMDGVTHHLVGTQSIHKPINAADFTELAIPIINECHSKNIPVVLVGGSGFYLQAILKGMYESITTEDKIILKSDSLYKEEGIEPFLKILKENDPESFSRYHENDHYRIRRAVEHFWQTNEKFSLARKNMDANKNISPVEKFGWNVYHAYLDLPKDEHFKIIQKRSQKMLDDGLIDEINTLLASHATGEEKPLNSIGYKETISYIRGEFSSKEDFLERLNINTRRLAKSQRTWFKKVEKVCYNPLSDKEKIINDCLNFCKEENGN